MNVLNILVSVVSFLIIYFILGKINYTSIILKQNNAINFILKMIILILLLVISNNFIIYYSNAALRDYNLMISAWMGIQLGIIVKTFQK